MWIWRDGGRTVEEENAVVKLASSWLTDGGRQGEWWGEGAGSTTCVTGVSSGANDLRSCAERGENDEGRLRRVSKGINSAVGSGSR